MASGIGSRTHLSHFDDNPHSSNQPSLSSKKTGGKEKSTFSNIKMAPSILETPVQDRYPHKSNPLLPSTANTPYIAPLTTAQKQRIDTLVKKNMDREFTPFLKTAKKKNYPDMYSNQQNSPSLAPGQSTNSYNNLGVLTFEQLDQSMESSIMEPKISNEKITQNGRQTDTSRQSSIPLKRQEEQVDQLSNEIINLKLTIVTLEAQLKHYRGIDTTKDEIIDENSKLRKELLGVVQAYKKLQNDYVNLQKNSNNNKPVKVSNFQSRDHHESLNDSADTSNNHVYPKAEMEHEIRKLNNELVEKTTQLESLEDEVAALKEKLDKEEEKVYNYEQQIFGNSRNSINSSVLGNQKEQEEKIRDLSRRVSSLQDQILAKDNKIEEIEAELENAKASKLKELQIQREELQAMDQQDLLQQTKEYYEQEKSIIQWENNLVSYFILFLNFTIILTMKTGN